MVQMHIMVEPKKTECVCVSLVGPNLWSAKMALVVVLAAAAAAEPAVVVDGVPATVACGACSSRVAET